MFLRNAALKPVPTWAVIKSHTLETLEEDLGDEEAGLQDALDQGYRDLDRNNLSSRNFLPIKSLEATMNLLKPSDIFCA